MSIVGLILTLVLIGVLLWVINTYIPMDPKLRQILNIVVVILVIIWLLQAFGAINGPFTTISPVFR
jgi:hypothetical protein